jgi:hypothetical protein
MPGGLGSKGFRKLAQRVEEKYVRKGYSRKRAEEIGRGTAANVNREKEAEYEREHAE